MRGLSITAIGLRPIEECIAIYRMLQVPLGLDYLELAIGSNCDPNRIPTDIPIVLHDRCLVSSGRRLPFSLLCEETWVPYIRFVEERKVLGMSVHPPKREEASLSAAIRHRDRLESVLGVAVMLEVMPSPVYWCSEGTLPPDAPLLLDVSHVNIWHRGDTNAVCSTIQRLMPMAKGIHLSHNNGKKDSHDLIPNDIWFTESIGAWSSSLLVTYESLPARFAEFERLDKQRRGRGVQHPQS